MYAFAPHGSPIVGTLLHVVEGHTVMDSFTREADGSITFLICIESRFWRQKPDQNTHYVAHDGTEWPAGRIVLSDCHVTPAECLARARVYKLCEQAWAQLSADEKQIITKIGLPGNTSWPLGASIAELLGREA